MSNSEWQQPVSIRPVGYVESPLKDFTDHPTYTEESYVVMREDLQEGLLGLEHFSHIYVLYHQHRRDEWKQRANMPTDREVLTMPLMSEPTCKGIYTSRSPARPSGIGFCIVQLLEKQGNRLKVRGLDAIDGTPVLDIKIYIARYDCFPHAEAPLHWCQKTELQTTSRLLHWDTMNVGLSLGMRAGQKALRELGLTRSDPKTAEVQGGDFFAQGVEAITGCSVLHGSMSFEEKKQSLADWNIRLTANGNTVSVYLNEGLYTGADEVMDLPDELLFRIIEKETIAR
jgi:tRNA-Thr(GGU) m(6)t(6)A37 methyltransferase TsaA